MLSSQPLTDPSHQKDQSRPPIPLIAMIGSKVTPFQTFYLIITRLLYYCEGIDKTFFEKCETLARESRGHFPLTAFPFLWQERGKYRNENFDFLYNRMRGNYDMGILYENTKQFKSLMKISMMSDAHILILALDEISLDMKQYLEDLREYILISKMSVKHFMIFINIREYDRIDQLLLDELLHNIKNYLMELSMENIRIICMRDGCNFTKDNELKTSIHPLFSNLNVQQAMLEFRNEILQDFKLIERNENLVFSIMGKEKIAGVGSTMIGRVLSGSMREDQELIISNNILSEVKSLEIFHEKQLTASVHKGDFCGVALRNISKDDIKRGSLFGIVPTHTFEAIVYITHSPTRGWKAGVTPTVYSTCVREPCRVTEILERLSKKTKVTLDSKPTTFKEKELVRLRFTCTKGIQLFNDPRWGKIILVHNNKVMGGGFISSLS